MRRQGWANAFATVALSLIGFAPGACSAPAKALLEIPGSGAGLAVVASGLEDPLELQAPAGDRRLFIVEQAGRIRIVRDGRLLPAPFLDLTSQVSYGGERGLLGLAFHPSYARNGYFFVNYTNRAGDTRVERYRVSRDPDRADPASRTLVLAVDQPYSNHNGGCIRFGPDGKLWIGMGDGGSGGDPHDNGQNPGTLLGKMLRIDVDARAPYAIPADNPFRGRAGARPEVWAIGLRNPWRFAFDPPENTVWIGDVGQNRWEEVNVADARRGGLDYGWDPYEGSHCFEPPCDPAGKTMPVLEYGRGDGCTVIGGYVYRGRAIPGWIGRYVYADYCQSWLRSVRAGGGRPSDAKEWRLPRTGSILSFGVDAAGELYLCCNDGRVYRFEPSGRNR